jgi:predicted permease
VSRERETAPPRLAVLCLKFLVPSPQRQYVLDDLAEEWSRRVVVHGRRAATLWYWRQVMQSIGPALTLRGGAGVTGQAGARFEFAGFVWSVRHAARRLRRTPGFTLAAGSTLAIGIASSVSIFSLVDGVLLRPLPFPESDRLVALRHVAAGVGPGEIGLSEGIFEHYRENNVVFEDIAIWQTASVNLTAESEPERVDLVLATPSFFPLLRVRPLIGPGFGSDAVGGTSVLLSYGLWQRRYGGDESLIGRTIEVNGASRVVAGVMAPDFHFPHPRIDLWMDLGVSATSFGSFHYDGAARLREGVSVEGAAADLRRLAAGVMLPGTSAGAAGSADSSRRPSGETIIPIVQPLRDNVVRDVSDTLWLLFGAMAFVLLVVVANVANLYLVRAAAREREVVVCAALGAGRGQLIRPFLAESMLLAAAGGAFGLLIGWMAVRTIVVSPVLDLPRLEEVAVNARVAVFAIFLSFLIAVVLGVLPAWRTVGVGVARGLRSAGRAFTASRERRRTQRVLVVIQVAAALTLLIGSALMLQTLWRLRSTNPGFDAQDVLTFEVILPYRGYETYDRTAGLQLALLDRVRRLPGVLSAGAVSGLPMATSEFPEMPDAVEVSGAANVTGALQRQVRYRLVTAGYFETMHIPVVQGFAPGHPDFNAAGAPILISANLAARLFPGENPLGQRIRRIRSVAAAEEERWNTIAGVVADVKHSGIAEPAPELIYLPVLNRAVDPGSSPGFLAFALRSNSATLPLVPGIRAIVEELDAQLPIANIRTMEAIVDAASARTTFIALLLGFATVAALFLGIVGIYGLISYAVGQRRREIGLRMALGARAEEVLRLVLRDGVRLTTAGVLIGFVASAFLTRFLDGHLFGVSANDPLTFFATALLLFTIGWFASALPARRASRIQPIEALADE